MATSITLEQLKVFATQFVTQERVTLSAPTKLANCFVMAPTLTGDYERLVRMATLTDIDDIAIPVNPLAYFTSASFPTFTGVLPNDYLRIYNFPTKWGPPTGTGYQSFKIAGFMVGPTTRIQIHGAFWTKLPAGTVSFDIVRGASTVIASGQDGKIERLDDTAPLWKCSRYLSSYAQASDALDHMTVTQTYVDALATEARMNGTDYLAYDPGNTVTNVF